MLKKIEAFAENAYVNLVSGLILFGTAMSEVVATVEEGLIGAHHGIALFGLLQVFRSLPHLVHASEQVSKVQKKSDSD